MAENWGRFTLRGGAAVEARITAMVEEVAALTASLLKPEEYRALVVLGGYGRGEGGVEAIDGDERPHNNIDFLFLTTESLREDLGAVRTRIETALRPIMKAYAIEIDISVMNASKLQHASNLMIWYDMRFGHKTVLGDAGFVPSLTRFERETIPAWDARNLLVNRGTLLVINDALLDEAAGAAESRDLITKHIMKALIGYGDALLFFKGQYDWSYAEKQRRVRTCPGIADSFRALYDEAAEFRFTPDYARYRDRDARDWMDAIREAVREVHRECESIRLAVPALTWEDYPARAFTHTLFDEPAVPRAWAKKVYYGMKAESAPAALPWLARLGYRAGGERNRMAVLFPMVAYALDAAPLRELARQGLAARNTTARELRRAYLVQWGRYGDVNFSSSLRKWKISLEPEDSAT
ncbi:MAG: hypothetical protein HYV27_23715 [Candidatus Hydrogenedentes bacterium]|nr:hypothetical protein [Candidatus Hydrogenedentota bacterium]